MARLFNRFVLLEWSTSGRARDLQVMYGLGGERRLTETKIPELEGYMNSKPVRIGNESTSGPDKWVRCANRALLWNSRQA